MYGFREQEHPYGRHWSDEFQKNRTSFSENHAPAFFGPVCHPSTFSDLAIFALASKKSLKTIWSVWESHSTQRGATGSWKFKKKRDLFSGENCSWDFSAPVAIQALLLTSKILSWLIDVPQKPYARFEGPKKCKWMSLVRCILKKR